MGCKNEVFPNVPEVIDEDIYPNEQLLLGGGNYETIRVVLENKFQ